MAFGEAPATGPGAGSVMNAAGSGIGEQHWFGVAVENIPPAIARQLKLKEDQGLMVVAVLPQSPAERAGLRRDDLLIELDGKELKSQTELAQAANALVETKNGAVPKVTRVAFLRDGDRQIVDVMPEVRPTDMLVIGGNLSSFVGHDRNNSVPAEEVKNYVLPNGSAAQVGPGYRLNLDSGDSTAVTVKSIKSLVEQGKTVVLAQETDMSGAVRSTISMGGKSYAVEPGKTNTLPPELRPLAEQLLVGAGVKGQPAELTTVPSNGANTAPADSADGKAPLERRVRELEDRNAKLQQEVEQLMEQVKKDRGQK